MTEVRAKRARLGHGSVVRAARILATGLVCYGVGVRAEVKTPMTETASVDYRRDSGSKLVLPSARSGAEDILRSSVIMDINEPERVWTRWSSSTLDTPSLALEWMFRTTGHGVEGFDGTVMFVVSPTKYQEKKAGRFFGIDANFTGLAVIVGSTGRLHPTDARREQRYLRHRDVAIVANNGTRSYDDLMANLGTCSTRAGLLNWRESPFDPFQFSRIRLKAYDNRVALDFHAAMYPGHWKRCVTTALVSMPTNWASESYVGVIAQKRSRTVGLTFRAESIPNDPWETDTKGRATRRIPGQRHAGAIRQEDPTSIRERLALAESSLQEACSDSHVFARCHRHGLSMLDLEWCLDKWGINIPERCAMGIATWKALVAQAGASAKEVNMSSGSVDTVGTLLGRPLRWVKHDRVGSGRGHGNSSGNKGNITAAHVGDKIYLFVLISLRLVVLFCASREFKKLVQRSNGHSNGNGGDTPDAHQTLPGNAPIPAQSQQRESAPSAGGDGDCVDDDDAIVVTGIPVHPPASVHPESFTASRRIGLGASVVSPQSRRLFNAIVTLCSLVCFFLFLFA